MKKNTKGVIALSVILIIAFAGYTLHERKAKQIAPYPCNTAFDADAPTFDLGSTVYFTLTNTTDANCTSNEEYPWMIWKLVGDAWEPCFSPVYDPTPWVLLPNESKTWTWDQITTEGSPATEGDYMVWIYYTSFSLGKLPFAPEGYVRECHAFFTITTPPLATTTPAPTTTPPPTTTPAPTTPPPTTTPPPGERGTPPPRATPPSSSGVPPSGEPPSRGIVATLSEAISENIIESILISILIILIAILIIKEIAVIYILLTLIPLIYMLYRIFLEKKLCIINLIIGFYILFLLYKRKKEKER